MTSYAESWKAADMSLRDYFAAQALGAMAAERYETNWREVVAANAYKLADAMLAARGKDREADVRTIPVEVAMNYPPAIKEEMEFVDREFEQFMSEEPQTRWSNTNLKDLLRAAFMRGWSLGRMWEEQEALKRGDHPLNMTRVP